MARDRLQGWDIRDYIDVGIGARVEGGIAVGSALAVSIDTTITRSGGGALKIAAMSATASQWQGFIFSSSTNHIGYDRFYIRVTSRPATTGRTIFGTATDLHLVLNPNGTLSLYYGASLIGTSTAALTDTTKWYCIEVRGVSGTGVTVLKIENSSEVVGNPSNWTCSAYFGPDDTIADTYTVYFDDFAGDNANWVGPGKVGLLVTDSDISNTNWRAGAGGLNGLYLALNNLPPAGVASANETDGTNIESASNTGTANYSVRTIPYSGLGISSGDTINAIWQIILEGEDINTGTKSGTFELTANPVVGATSFSFGNDGGAHGLYSDRANTKWVNHSVVTQTPSVTLGTGATVKLVKTDTTTRVGCVCFVGVYVDWTPAPSGADYPRSVASTIAHSVTADRVVGRVRPVTSSIAPSVNIARAVANTRALSGSIPHSLSISKGTSKAISSSIGHGAGVARALSNKRAVTGTISHTSSANRIAGIIRATGSSISSSALVARALALTRRLPLSTMSRLLYSDGVLAEDFEVIGDWTVGGGGSIAANTAQFRSGAQSIKLTTGIGAQSYMTKTVNWDLSNCERVRLWFYLHDLLANYGGAVILALSNDSGFTNFFRAWWSQATINSRSAVPGWNCMSWPKDFFKVGAGAPSWASPIVRVRLYCQAVAAQQVSVSFDELRTGLSGQPSIMLRFDDGYASTYTIAYPKLASKGMRGSVFVISGYVGNANYMTAAQLTELGNAGWLLCNHADSGTSFLGQSQATVESRLATCDTFLNGLGCPVCPQVVAYPNGDFDDNTLAAMANTGRWCNGGTYGCDKDGTTPGIPLTLPFTGMYQLTSTAATGLTLAQLQALADGAIAGGVPISIHFHEIGGAGYNQADFEAFIDYIASLGLVTNNLKDFYLASLGPAQVIAGQPSRLRTIGQTVSHTSGAARVLALARGLSSVVSHTSGAARVGAHPRAIGSTITHTSQAGRSIGLSRAMGASIAHAVTVARRVAAVRTVSGTIAHSLSAARQLVLTRAIAGTIAHTAGVEGIRTPAGGNSYTRAFTWTINHAMGLTRVVANTRPVSSLIAHTAAIARVLTLTRATSSTISSTTGAARQVGHPRSVSVAAIAHTVAIARKVVSVRTVAGAISHTMGAARLLSLSRAISSTMNSSSASTRVIGLVRGIARTNPHSSTAGRGVSAGRAIGSVIVHGVGMERVAAFGRSVASLISHSVSTTRSRNIPRSISSLIAHTLSIARVIGAGTTRMPIVLHLRQRALTLTLLQRPVVLTLRARDLILRLFNRD